MSGILLGHLEYNRQKKKKFDGLGDQLIAGMVCMHKAGYIFTGITIDNNGNYEKVTQCCGDNAGVLAEMITGEFDGFGRVKSGIAWAKIHIPSLDLSVIEKMVEEAEKEAG